MTFTVQADGSVKINGTSTGYSHIDIFKTIHPMDYNVGMFYVSLELDNPNDFQGQVGFGMRFIDKRVTPNTERSFYARCTTSQPKAQNRFEITQAMLDALNSGDIVCEPRIEVTSGAVANEVVIRPMIRLVTDPDDTWQPFAKSNKQLTDKQNELAAIAGEYLVSCNGGTSKKRIVAVGATECFFYYGDFADKYGITSTSDLNFDISAETVSGNVVTYNQIALNTTSRSVYIRFDALTEQATFICKCSKII